MSISWNEFGGVAFLDGCVGGGGAVPGLTSHVTGVTAGLEAMTMAPEFFVSGTGGLASSGLPKPTETPPHTAMTVADGFAKPGGWT